MPGRPADRRGHAAVPFDWLCTWLAGQPDPVGVLSRATGGDLASSYRYRHALAPSGIEHELRAAARDLVDRGQLADPDDRLEALSLRLFADERDIRVSLDVDEVVARTPMGQKDYIDAWVSLGDTDDEDGRDRLAR